MTRLRAPGIVLCLAWASAATAAMAVQPTVRLGEEFQVNVYTMHEQSQPAVAWHGAGGFVVAWPSSYQDGEDFGVFAARFDSIGNRLGSEFQVNTVTAQRQRTLAAAMDNAGRFVIAWANYTDGSGYGISARRFDAQGVRLGAELQVNTYTSGWQVNPAVAMDADGDFVVVWDTSNHVPGQDGSVAGIFGQRFGSAGDRKGVEFQVNVYTTGYQFVPSIDLDDDGDFVVAWVSFFDQDGDGGGVFTRRFTSAGVGGVEVLANVVTAGNQSPSRRAIAMDSDGDFIVVWTSGELFARRFNALGAPNGGEFQVNSATYGLQRLPSIAINAQGEFVIAWDSRDFTNDLSYEVLARRFSSAGVPGEEFQVSTYTVDAQERAAVAMSDGVGFVVVWESKAQDGSGYGVFAQRFATLAVLDVDGNGSFDALTDGLLILRFGFGFSGQTLVTGAVGAGCTRCDSPSIMAYLQTID
jgi:hypothetical protein